MNPYSISIHPQFTIHFKVKHGSVLIGYYKLHEFDIRVILGVGNRKIIWVAIIKMSIDL